MTRRECLCLLSRGSFLTQGYTLTGALVGASHARVAWLEQAGLGLRRLQEALDTTTPSGQLTFHIFGALAEFERQLIQERPQAGLRVARARGRLGGRPKALPAEKRQWAVQLY